MRKISFLSGMVFLVLFSCKNQLVDNSDPTGHDATEAENQHLHWSYQGETGPAHWMEIEKDSDCGGQHQSPVNIIEVNARAVSGEDLLLEFSYADSTRIHDVTNNGHSIQYNFELGDFIQFKGKKYALKQIHFHEPSEHLINGIRYPIEMHMVHAGEDGELTVLGIMGTEGENSAPFQFLEKFLPVEKETSKIVDEAFNLNLNLPANHKDYFHYSGSLTTPPCSENVNWIVLKEPITLSLEQVTVLRSLMPVNNYRTEQPLNDRVVLKSF